MTSQKISHRIEELQILMQSFFLHLQSQHTEEDRRHCLAVWQRILLSAADHL